MDEATGNRQQATGEEAAVGSRQSAVGGDAQSPNHPITQSPAAQYSTLNTQHSSVRDTLNDVAQGLLMMSESDRPIKAFTWGANKTGDAATPRDALLAAVKPEDPAQVTSLSVDDFFAPMTAPKNWWGDEEKETGAKFDALVDALKTNLTDPEAFRIEGDSEIPVYIVGKDANGTWSGIKTEVVET